MHGGYQVVVGTPGRLRDHLNRGTLQLDRVRMLVLDEADEMLDQGFAPEVEAIIQSMPLTAKRQTALFSATLPEWVKQTAANYLRPDHASIRLEASKAQHLDIEHLVYDMNPADKTYALRHLLDNDANQSVLVFARTKHGVKKLAAKLQDEGYAAAGLQGNLSQRAREEVMAAFRSNKIRIMVATNVGARGLDVSGIGHVINFDLPESAELFTHRVGRTGRNGASGTAITFLTGEDRSKWYEIERAMSQTGIYLERKRWDGPRAEPGAVPAIIQPVQGQRFFSSFKQQERPTQRSFNRDQERPAQRPFNRDQERPAQRPFNRDQERPFNREHTFNSPTNGNVEGGEQQAQRPSRRRSGSDSPNAERPGNARYNRKRQNGKEW
jgi:superfamily II DNA/RNA helicase